MHVHAPVLNSIHLKLEYVSKDSRNLSTASNTNWYCSCEWDCDSKSAWVVWVIGYSPLWEQDLASGYAGPSPPGTHPPHSQSYSDQWWSAMAQNMPDLLTVSLEMQYRIIMLLPSDGCWPSSGPQWVLLQSLFCKAVSHCWPFLWPQEWLGEHLLGRRKPGLVLTVVSTQSLKPLMHSLSHNLIHRSSISLCLRLCSGSWSPLKHTPTSSEWSLKLVHAHACRVNVFIFVAQLFCINWDSSFK